MVARALVLVGISPRVPRQLLLEIWPLPARGVAEARLEALEALLRGRVATDVELELVERRTEELDLDASCRLSRLADPPEQTRTDQPGEHAQDDHHDEEFDEREPGLASCNRAQ